MAGWESALGRVVERLGQRGLDVAVWIVTRAFFGRLCVRHRERIPRGAVLVVANHPAAWADGILLAVALRRRPHFLVHGPLYRPWIRGWLLRLYGSLPLFPSRRDPEALTGNTRTMRQCERHLERGEAVATFPEGISRSDWRLQPLKTGAAWLALGYAAGHDRAPPFHLLPVGLFYRDRIAFRGDVEIVVGRPLDVSRYREAFVRDPPEAARALTRDIADALRAMIVHAPDVESEALARELLSMAAPVGSGLDRARELVASLVAMRQASASRFDGLWRRVKRYRRLRDAMRLTDHAIRLPPSRAEAWGALLRLAIGLPLAPLALVGWGIHAIPARTTRALTRRWAVESSRIAFARIAVGTVVFTAAYVLAGAALHWGAGWSHTRAFLALAAAAWLGAASRPYRRFMSETIVVLRRLGLERFAPRKLARARRARQAVWSMIDPPLDPRSTP